MASAAVTQDMPSVLWKVVRQDDGSFVLINKTEQQYAVVHKSSLEESVVANKAPFMWQLKYGKDGSVTGFRIMARKSNYGWYMPESVASHVILRTANQWNNFWKLERTPIPTGLERLPVFESTSGVTASIRQNRLNSKHTELNFNNLCQSVTDVTAKSAKLLS